MKMTEPGFTTEVTLRHCGKWPSEVPGKEAKYGFFQWHQTRGEWGTRNKVQGLEKKKTDLINMKNRQLW